MVKPGWLRISQEFGRFRAGQTAAPARLGLPPVKRVTSAILVVSGRAAFPSDRSWNPDPDSPRPKPSQDSWGRLAPQIILNLGNGSYLVLAYRQQHALSPIKID
jgi:hypothetical protein